MTPEVAFVARGGPGSYPGSVQVRLIRQLEYAARTRSLRFRQTDATAILNGAAAGATAVVVERDGLGAADADQVALRISAAGARLVVDVDDDFYTPDAQERLLRGGYSANALATLVRLTELADRVLVSTPRLAAIVADITPRVTEVRNSVDANLWRPSRGPLLGRGRRILYMGSATHDSDLEMIRPAVEALPAEQGVGLDVIGVTEGDAGWYRRIEIPEGRTHYPQFVGWLRGQRTTWCLGVAPLTPDPFNSAKSDLKFLEYSMLGLATVASGAEPYRGLDRVGATLVDDDAVNWTAALARLLGDPAERRRLARRAAAYCRAQRTTESSNDWVTAVLGIAF